MKSSFIIHLDSLDVMDDLTDEQCGELLRAMKAYHEKDDYTPSSIVKVAFSPFKNQFIRDLKKYESIVERNRINGLKGGRPLKENKPTGLLGNPDEPKKADSVNGSGSKSDNDSDSKKEEPKQKKTKAPVVAKPDDVEMEVWQDWLLLRKTKKASVTNTVLKGARKEAEKAGLLLNEFLTVWCVRGSQGLEASWLTPKEKQPHRKELSDGFEQKDTRSRAKKHSDKLDEIARRDIEENGFTQTLD